MEQDWNARGDMAESERLKDWLESQSRVLGFWMDRTVARVDEETFGQLKAHQRSLDELLQRLGGAAA